MSAAAVFKSPHAAPASPPSSLVGSGWTHAFLQSRAKKSHRYGARNGSLGKTTQILPINASFANRIKTLVKTTSLICLNFRGAKVKCFLFFWKKTSALGAAVWVSPQKTLSKKRGRSARLGGPETAWEWLAIAKKVLFYGFSNPSADN